MRAIHILFQWLKRLFWAALILCGLIAALFLIFRWGDGNRLRGMRAGIERSLPGGCEVVGWFTVRIPDTMAKEGGMRLGVVAFVRSSRSDDLKEALTPLTQKHEAIELQPFHRGNLSYLEEYYLCGEFDGGVDWRRRIEAQWRKIPEQDADYMIFVTDTVRRGWPTAGWPGQEIFRYSPG